MKFRVNLTGISTVRDIYAEDPRNAAWKWAYSAPEAIWATTPLVEIEVRASGSDVSPERFSIRSTRQFHVESV